MFLFSRKFEFERVRSAHRAFRIFQQHDLVNICPEKLNISAWNAVFTLKCILTRSLFIPSAIFTLVYFCCYVDYVISSFFCMRFAFRQIVQKNVPKTFKI